MTTIRRFTCDDLLSFNNVNLDVGPDLAREKFLGLTLSQSRLVPVYFETGSGRGQSPELVSIAGLHVIEMTVGEARGGVF